MSIIIVGYGIEVAHPRTSVPKPSWSLHQNHRLYNIQEWPSKTPHAQPTLYNQCECHILQDHQYSVYDVGIMTLQGNNKKIQPRYGHPYNDRQSSCHHHGHQLPLFWFSSSSHL